MLNLLKKMINKSNQKQDAGDNSTNLQGQQVIVNQGISYSDAKEIANDVFKANFIELKQEAAVIAQKRAEEVTDKVISQLNERHPESINEFETPALQDALFTVQKQFAISGDQDLGDLLVDILVDRAAAPKRNMVQIVLDESLGIAPKLTIEQFDTLTLNFLLISTRRLDVGNYEELLAHFRRRIVPFVENLSEKNSDYTHAEYLGCGHVRAGNYGQLEENLRKTYKAYFSKGFTEEELKEKIGEDVNLQGLIIRCFHDDEKLQIGLRDEKELDEMAQKNGLSDDIKQKLKQLFESSTKPANEVKNMLIDAIPEMEKVFEVWAKSPFDQFELTSVGIAIAHANYRRKIGDTMDLSLWIK
ncbi:LPO_1073/Vpar_1526 family protein [Pseudoalteromonas ruthenica]|uniref:LPO_1073/Vpar_1526 family protein n=1 Tax=Pseudoalteromonas ruthenica TaxID=151081 RepID=UPI00034A7705|nr:LPO_1073/Vpar_1526 family protein [Pseudoalteromonas ruthenica]